MPSAEHPFADNEGATALSAEAGLPEPSEGVIARETADRLLRLRID
ncbi:hypothetical protein [Amycolatopsis sp. PS_44_ISF1]|nr:hypothetical protein [Amycolatopsis sp. PS_44_ISF1]MDT8912266.1 hypothetical protein [Amycolatopsis sp. PS_44_ISF1]